MLVQWGLLVCMLVQWVLLVRWWVFGVFLIEKDRVYLGEARDDMVIKIA